MRRSTGAGGDASGLDQPHNLRSSPMIQIHNDLQTAAILARDLAEKTAGGSREDAGAIIALSDLLSRELARLTDALEAAMA